MSRQLDYYYRKGKAQRKAKSKAKKQAKIFSSIHIPTPAIQSNDAKLKLRLHRLQRTYKIENAVSEERLRALRLNDKLVNIKQWLGAGFRLIRGNSWSLELEGIELVSDYMLPVAFLEAQAHSLSDNIARSLAAQYGFKISKEGHTPALLTEIELSATQMTKRLKEIEKKGVVPLYEGTEGKIWVDWSFGIGGIESNNIEYLQRLTDLAKDIALKDAWQQTKDLLIGLAEAQTRTQHEIEGLKDNQAYQNQFFVTHNALIEQLQLYFKMRNEDLERNRAKKLANQFDNAQRRL